MTLGRRWDELRFAVMFLTRLPVGPIGAPVPEFGRALWAFPVVGAVAGAAGWAVFALAGALALPDSICAILAVAAGLFVTGALHEDGLADFADGMGGGATRDRKLEIMRDSRIGTYGAAAMGVALALRATSLASLGVGAAGLAAFVALGAASRAAMVVAASAMPAARDGGLGRSVEGADRRQLAAGLGLTLLALAALGTDAWGMVAIMAAAGLVPAALARRKLGGQTGDVLGAIQQVAETAGWVALAALAQG